MSTTENKFLTDIEIAQNNEMEHIKEIAAKLNIAEDDFEMYGKTLPIPPKNRKPVKSFNFSASRPRSIFS